MVAGCQQPGGLFAPPPAPGPVVASDQAFGEIVGGQYVVAPGDTVAVVSERTNTPIRTLIDLNRLTPPYALQPGQRLSLQPRGDYVVQKGDTVSGIAARQGVSISALIQLNNLRAPYTLQVGQTLVLPSGADAPQPGAQAAAAPQAKPFVPGTPAPQPQPEVNGQPQVIGAQPTTPGTNAAPQDLGGGVTASSLPPLQPAPTPQAVPAPQPVPAPQTAPQTASIEPPAPPVAAAPAPKGDPLPDVKPDSAFIWPVDGKVIGKFGPTKDNQRNDGINIAAPAGAPVLASAAGTVAYAGNELRGFGNMVLLRHADGWVTAYAHNSALLVKKGDKVKQGQIIARVGSTGSVDTPQLHFELRQGTKAVDPLKNLTR